MGHPLGRLALLHPFPSALNAAVVAALATIAGGEPGDAALAAIAMLGFQVSIGALNDLVDVEADRAAQPWKPIPAGRVSEAAARAVTIGGASLGVVASLLIDPLLAVVGVTGYACGVAYDLDLKRRGLGWVAFAAAFPLLLLFGWAAGGGGLPPGWPILLPLAAMAGPALHLANAMADLDPDTLGNPRSAVVRLGHRRTAALLTLLMIAVQLLAWMIIASLATDLVPLALAVVSTAFAATGLAGSWRGTPRAMGWGWTLQALSVAILAVAWVTAAA